MFPLCVAFALKLIGYLFQCRVMSHSGAGDAARRCPVHRVVQDLGDVFPIECGVFFMTGAEIKDLAQTTLIAAAASEDFTAGEPADENQLVGSGDLETLSVCFLLLQYFNYLMVKI